MVWRSTPLLLLLVMLTVASAARSFSMSHPETLDVDRASILTAGAMLSDAGSSPASLQLRAPGYPLVLTMLAKLDAEFSAGIACSSEERTNCAFGPALDVLLLIQTVLPAIALVIAGAIAWELSRSVEISAIMVCLTLLFGRFDDAPTGLFAHVWYLATAMLAMYFLVSALTHSSCARAAGTGAAIAAAASFEPTFLIVAPTAMLALVKVGRGPAAAACLFAGCLAALAIMIVVMHSLHYDPIALWRHSAWHLSERVAFNQLDGQSWWCGLLLPIPFVGGLATSLFPEPTVASFGYYVPGTFVHDGTNIIFPAVLSQPGGPLGQLCWLVNKYVILQPIDFLAASAPLLVRGLMAATGVLGLLGLLHTRRLLRWSSIEPSRPAVMAVLSCTGALLLANTLVTANPIGINPTLAFVFAYAVAYVAAGA